MLWHLTKVSDVKLRFNITLLIVLILQYILHEYIILVNVNCVYFLYSKNICFYV